MQRSVAHQWPFRSPPARGGAASASRSRRAPRARAARTRGATVSAGSPSSHARPSALRPPARRLRAASARAVRLRRTVERPRSCVRMNTLKTNRICSNFAWRVYSCVLEQTAIKTVSNFS